MVGPLQPAADGPLRHSHGMVEGVPGVAREPFHHQRPPCPKGDGNGARDQGFAARSGFGPQADLQTSDIAKEFAQLNRTRSRR